LWAGHGKTAIELFLVVLQTWDNGSQEELVSVHFILKNELTPILLS
jgi:hypothetical protein